MRLLLLSFVLITKDGYYVITFTPITTLHIRVLLLLLPIVKKSNFKILDD